MKELINTEIREVSGGCECYCLRDGKVIDAGHAMDVEDCVNMCTWPLSYYACK